MTPPNRIGLPKPDLRHPGRWIPITPQQQPEAFRTPEELAEVRKRSAARRAHPKDPGAGGAAVHPERGSSADGGEEIEDEVEEPLSDEEDGDYVRGGAKRGLRKSGLGRRVSAAPPQDSDEDDEDEEDDEEGDINVPDDVLDVDETGWRARHPKTQPLTYLIHKNAAEEKIAKTIKFTVDFTSNASVAKANKARGLQIWRAKRRHGLVDLLKRESTADRLYTDENKGWISREIDSYAVQNQGKRIPISVLTARYNARFPVEGRSESSINALIGRTEDLRAKRMGYDL